MAFFFDGAFGTYYLNQTGSQDACELANLTSPNVVLSIHKEYINAGATGIKTNTFGVNPSAYPEDRWRTLLTKGYQLAMDATEGTDAQVFADIGNIPFGSAPKEQIEQQYIQLADAFLSLGATRFLFETMYEFETIKPALAYIKEQNKEALIVVSFAVSQDGFSRQGLYYKTLISQAADNPHVDMTGLNCVCGPTHLAHLVKALGTVSKPLVIMPNAGYPSTLNGRTVFRDNAEYFAEKSLEIHLLGVDFLGGCCGTTPKHIELAAKAVSGKRQTPVAMPGQGAPAKTAEPATRLAPKELLAELDPPVNGDYTFLLSAIKTLQNCGVTTITLTDSPLAKVRADSMLSAAKVKTIFDVDVMPHITCRDKNRLAIKGALLGASAFGVEKILAVTGDPVCDGTEQKPGVFDFSSQQLISYIKNINDDFFADHPFQLGGAINVNARNFENEMNRCRKKLEYGATFLISQPIFTQAAADNFKRASEQLNCKLYAAIMPVASYRNALFLNNEVSGITLPQSFLEQLKGIEKEQVYQHSIAFAADIIRHVYPYADGFHFIPPLGKIDLVVQLIERCFDV